MFKHRLGKIGKASLFAACMLLAGGSFVSCEDDYYYPDREPEWLGASIYNFLETGSPGHTYSHFVELIDSLGEKETLAHTGSNTLFVADDSAFMRFFKNNPWGVTSIKDMTDAQRKILLYSSMLDNAMLLDMLSSTGASDSEQGTCLRRLTSAKVIDTIAFTDERPSYNKYWDALRGTEKEKMLLAKDGSRAMMVHFLPEYLKNNAIKASDIEFLFRKSGQQTKTFSSEDAMVFGNKIVDSDVPTNGFSDDKMTITCKNGYIYRLDDVLLPPSNMAEELRRHENTTIFSHLLDRFCIPQFDQGITDDYRALYNVEDSVFRLRYFTKSGFTTYDLLPASKRPTADELLNYDPGFNEIKNSLDKERDMAAMFVPNDKVLYEYFVDGAGKFLLDQFAADVDVNDYASLMAALDRVPENNIAPFLNNLMQSTFAGTVLSKFNKIVDDANDEMGISEDDVDECVIANNGVIYILNNVFGPATYQAVSAPTIVFDNMQIMKKIILDFKYNYYLLAMDAEYSFIVPDDTAFVYYDPVSKRTVANETKANAYIYHNDNQRPKSSGAVEFWAEALNFNAKTYEITDTLKEIQNAIAGDHATRLKDIMEYLIIVHDENDGIIRADGSLNEKKYYQTKGYGTIMVDTSDPKQIKFYGGEQIENGTPIVPKVIYEQKNGYTFCTVPMKENTATHRYSGVPTPPTMSVYDRFLAQSENDGPFKEFVELCVPEGMSVTDRLGLIFPEAKKVDTDSAKLYSIFYTGGKMINVVPFFNTYHYSVYVPSNEAVLEMLNKGLCNWDEISAIAETTPKKAAAQMRQLNNFLRYHFQDNSVYVEEKVPFSILAPGGGRIYEADFATAVVDSKTGRFYETTVMSAKDNSTLLVIDQLGREAKVVKEGKEGETWNAMTRDMEYNSGTKPTAISTSSFAVIHSIDKALLNAGLLGYDSLFCRYSDEGELVDTMNIEGVKGSVSFKNSALKPYLVANYGVVKIADKAGVERNMRLGYLMTPLAEGSEGYAKHTQETYVLDDENNKILVTNEGLWVRAVTEKNKPTVYEYVVDEQNRMLKLNNNGDIVDRIEKSNASSSN